MATLKQKEMGRGMAAWTKSRRSKTRPSRKQTISDGRLGLRSGMLRQELAEAGIQETGYRWFPARKPAAL